MRSKMHVLISVFVLLSTAVAAELQTPLERHGYKQLSSHQEMMAYLRALAAGSDAVTMQVIGRSVEGRDLPALFFTRGKTFGANRETKPVVLIYCQQHGNEPSGKEGALVVARRLLREDKKILDALDLILVPQMNPDGAEKGRRRNGNDMDLNRNHVILSEPEVAALHALFLQWMPEATLDVHEYNAVTRQWVSHGFIKDAEEMLGTATNLNVAPALIRISRKVVLPGVEDGVRAAGFTFHEYIVGAPFENQRVRYSTTAINDGRQSMAIYNTLSFIIEGKRYGDLLTHIRRRTEGQAAAILAFLRTIAQHREQVLQHVRTARKALTAGMLPENGEIYLQMDYFPDAAGDSLTFPVFDLYTWHHVEKKLGRFEPLVKVKKSVRKPYAYLFSGELQKLIDLLVKHRIRMARLQDETRLAIEVYAIRHVTPAVDEEKPALTVDANRRREERTLPRGSIVVRLDQPAANLIPLLLEPESTWNVATVRSGRKYRFAEFLQEGMEYPIYRLPEPAELNVRVIKTE